jgi:3-phenylpropionate/trans-cinnamate dioxygenase ferredoxin reductase component
VLACGAKPSPFSVPGGEQALQLRSLADAQALRSTASQADSAVVIGAGFIGCEAAASLAMRGVPTTLVAPDPVPQAKRLGEEAGARIVKLLGDAGARYMGSVSVSGIGDGAVHLDNGVTIDCDLILAATGVQPRSALAAAAGITTSEGRIIVDAQMRSSAENVYAAGDVALAYNSAAGRSVVIEHWQDAVNQGEIAGTGAAGQTAEWDSVPGFWTTIGEATLKHHAWGDGFDRFQLVEHDDGFTVWYESAGATVGVLTYNADDDYDRGEDLIRHRAPIPR